MRKRWLICLLLFAFGALLAAGCGSGEGERIPEETARALNEELEVLAREVDEEDCEGAEEAMTAIMDSANDPDAGIEGEVRTALEEVLANLNELVRNRCEDEEETTTTEPTTTPIPTEPTTTEPETTTETETTTTDPEPKPPEDNGGQGQGPDGGGPPGQDDGGGGPPSDGGVGPDDGEGD